MPSWGVGLIYGHVDLLRSLGVEAFVLHESADFVPSWLPSAQETSRLGLRDRAFGFRSDDVLVVPEVDALKLPEMNFPGDAWLFVQGSLPMLQSVPNASALAPLGYRGALVTMPHLERLVERFYGLTTHRVPPFVSELFFEANSGAPRERTVLLHVKEAIDALGLPDRRTIEQFWPERAAQGWRLERLRGLSQAEVAERFRRASLFVNLNLVEGFNATVAEAMASGCPCLTYDAVCGRDYLVGAGERQNAFVFGNGDVVALAEELFGLMASWQTPQTEAKIEAIAAHGRRSMEPYRIEATRAELEQLLRLL